MTCIKAYTTHSLYSDYKTLWLGYLVRGIPL